MTPKPSFSLPHGASGIEFGDFVIEFRNDKVVALAKDRGEHYTLHAGHASGILDIHRTWRDPDGTERHQTVFAMRHADLSAFLADLSPLTSGMFRLFRRLRPGWLYRNNIGVVRGLDPLTDEDMAAVTRRRPGRKRIVVDEDKLRANMRIPEYLDEIWDFPDGAFSLMAGGRRIGVGIKATDRTGRARLYWFKPRDVSKFFRAFEDRFIATALKYAIPREKYKEYGVLEP
jgi:hypothetical protein